MQERMSLKDGKLALKRKRAKELLICNREWLISEDVGNNCNKDWLISEDPEGSPFLAPCTSEEAPFLAPLKSCTSKQSLPGPALHLNQLPELVTNILKRVVVEDLWTCKRVCKAWKTIIKSVEFSREWDKHQAKQQPWLLICHRQMTPVGTRWFDDGVVWGIKERDVHYELWSPSKSEQKQFGMLWLNVLACVRKPCCYLKDEGQGELAVCNLATAKILSLPYLAPLVDDSMHNNQALLEGCTMKIMVTGLRSFRVMIMRFWDAGVVTSIKWVAVYDSLVGEWQLHPFSIGPIVAGSITQVVNSPSMIFTEIYSNKIMCLYEPVREPRQLLAFDSDGLFWTEVPLKLPPASEGNLPFSRSLFSYKGRVMLGSIDCEQDAIEKDVSVTRIAIFELLERDQWKCVTSVDLSDFYGGIDHLAEDYCSRTRGWPEFLVGGDVVILSNRYYDVLRDHEGFGGTGDPSLMHGDWPVVCFNFESLSWSSLTSLSDDPFSIDHQCMAVFKPNIMLLEDAEILRENHILCPWTPVVPCRKKPRRKLESMDAKDQKRL